MATTTVQRLLQRLAEQKRANPFLLIEDEETFVRYRMHVHDSTRTYPMSPMTLEEVNALL